MARTLPSPPTTTTPAAWPSSTATRTSSTSTSQDSWSPTKCSAPQKIARTLAFFHWPLRFPEIAERGGFDFVTGNPPWEVVKLDRRDWFATRDTDIASAATTPANAMIAALAETNPELAREWRLASAAEARQADFMRFSGRYARSGNEPNTYLLFTDLNATNTRGDGRAAFIVKSGLGIDTGGQATFQPLLAESRVEGFYDIVNGGHGETTVFEGVAQVERFTVLSLGPPNPSAGLAVSMMNRSIEEARTRDARRVSPADLRTLNPVTFSLPSFREPEHWEIALRLHKTHPTLDFDTPTKAELESGAALRSVKPLGPQVRQTLRFERRLGELPEA